MSSPFSSIFPAFPLLPAWTPPKAPIEKLKVFYQLERTLFTRLVLVLNRDIGQSVQVLGFLLMLERKDYAGVLAAQLIKLQDSDIDIVANEIGFCLNLLYHKDFLSSLSFCLNNNYRSVIPRTVQLTEGKFGLNEINEKREALLAGLNEALSDTCNRLFEDLIEKAERCNMEKFLALKSLASASSL